jgi:hypothetical protein
LVAEPAGESRAKPAHLPYAAAQKRSREGHTVRRTFTTLAAMLLALSMMATGASATSSVTWDGVHGLDSVRECDQGESPYMHWVLTSGSKGASLSIDGAAYQPSKTNKGSTHFTTAFHKPSDVTTATVSSTSTFTKNALLTISDACYAKTTGPGNGGGDISNPEPCDAQASATGGVGVTSTVHAMGATSGTFEFYIAAYNVPDRFQVFYEGNVIFDQEIGTGATGSLGSPNVDPVYDKTVQVPFGPGVSQQVTVVVTGASGTVWDYRISCPQ